MGGRVSAGRVSLLYVDQTEELIAMQKRHDLHLPQDVVVLDKFDGDELLGVGNSSRGSYGNGGDGGNENNV